VSIVLLRELKAGLAVLSAALLATLLTTELIELSVALLTNEVIELSVTLLIFEMVAATVWVGSNIAVFAWVATFAAVFPPLPISQVAHDIPTSHVRFLII